VRPNSIDVAAQTFDSDLRDATISGDAYDIKTALIALHDSQYPNFIEAIELNLGAQHTVTSAEVIDATMTRVFNKLADYARMKEEDVSKIVHRFLNGEVSGIELILVHAGYAKRGVIGDLLRKSTRHKKLARQFVQRESGEVLSSKNNRRFSIPEAQDVIDTKAKIAALNAALVHLDPNERLAIALKYDVAGVGLITHQQSDPETRATQLYELAKSFGFSNSKAELLRYRFKEYVAAMKVFTSDEPSSARPVRELRQKDIAALLGIDEQETSKLFKGARGKMKSQLMHFAA